MKNLLLIEDLPIVATGIQYLLETSDMGEVVVCTVNTLERMSEMMKEKHFDMAIIGLPQETGKLMELVRHSIKQYPSTAIILLVSRATVSDQIKLYRAGLHGIVNKAASLDEMRLALKKVGMGDIYVSNLIFEQLLHGGDKRPVAPQQHSIAKLTTREKEVAELLLKGEKNYQIGRRLELKPSTVSSFKTRIFNKLHVHNVIELSKIPYNLRNA